MFSRLLSSGKRSLESLSEQEILALAISSEEDDGRIYLAYADELRDAYPNSARIFEEMAEEESHHRQMLIDRHIERFGDRIPLVRREYVRRTSAAPTARPTASHHAPRSVVITFASA